MSHMRKIEVSITDLDALKKAFAKFGWVNMEENTNINTYAYDPLKDQLFDYVFKNPLGVKGYDVGFKKEDDSLIPFVDFYDASVEKQLGKAMSNILVQYNIEAAKNIVSDLEDRYEEPTITKTQDGWTEVCFEKI